MPDNVLTPNSDLTSGIFTTMLLVCAHVNVCVYGVNGSLDNGVLTMCCALYFVQPNEGTCLLPTLLM